MPRDISHPANREVLLYLLVNHTVYRQSHEELRSEPLFCEDDEVSIGDLRTHPDLGGYLRAAAQRLPGVKRGYILGYDVLVNTHDIILAIATGMAYMAYRRNPPDSGAQKIIFDETKKIENLSHEWVSCSIVGSDWTANLASVESLCQEALARVDQIGRKE